MFSNEKQLQSLIHEHPEVLTSGLFDIARQINGEEVPNLISLGREIPLQSGALDNLFIDANGILTVVECKLYSNSEIRREVYSQAVNYLADIQADLR